MIHPTPLVFGYLALLQLASAGRSSADERRQPIEKPISIAFAEFFDPSADELKPSFKLRRLFKAIKLAK